MKRVPCAFSVSRDFLDVIDARAESLGLSRSAYIVQVLRKELASGSSQFSIVAEEPPVYVSEQKNSGNRRKRKKT